jgi:hypothetical protein
VLNIASNVNALNGNFTGNVTAADANISGNINANIGNITNDMWVGGNTTTVGTAFSAAANVTGNLRVGGDTTIVGVMTSQTANIAGLMTAGNVETDVVTANVANIAGNVNAVNGNFDEAVTAANGVFSANVTAVNTTLSGEIKAQTGNILGDFEVGGTANIAGSMNSDTANVTGNAIIGNVSTGIMESNIANIACNLTSGNANLGNLATANFFSGDGGLLSNIKVDGQFSAYYSYTDVNPLDLVIVPTGKTVIAATVIVVTPFNDPAATLSMGTAADANSILTTADIVPGSVGTYTAYPATRYGSDTQLVMGIVPGTSTQGDGVLTINFI